MTALPLGPFERVFLLGVLRTGDDRALLALSPPERARVESAALAQRALPKPERASVIAALLQSLTATIPAGIDRIHPSWITRVLAEEPPEVCAIVLGEAPPALQEAVRATWSQERIRAIAEAARIEPAAAIRTWLRRRTLGQLVPMTPLEGTPPELSRLLALPVDELAEALATRARAFSGMDADTFSIAPLDAASAAIAARALAPLLAGAPREVLAQLAQRLPASIGLGLSPAWLK